MATEQKAWWPSSLSDTTPLLWEPSGRSALRSGAAAVEMTESSARTAFLGVDVGTGSARAGLFSTFSLRAFPPTSSFVCVGDNSD